MAQWLICDTFREHRMDRTSGAVTGDPKIALVTAAYTFDQNTHEFFDDITNEVSGTGYTAGGNAVANFGISMNASGLVTIDSDDPATWLEDAGGFSNARRAVLYFDTGTAGTSRLVAVSEDFGSDRGNADGDFAIELDADGIITSVREVV